MQCGQLITTVASLHTITITMLLAYVPLIGIENKLQAYHRNKLEAMMFEHNELTTDNDDGEHGGSDVDCQ